MSELDERVELFRDDFTSYAVCEKFSDVGEADCEEFGPWRQTSLHYAWRSERIPRYRDCRLPWRIIERDGRRFLDQPESFFNAVLAAGDPLWRDYELAVGLAVADGPAGPVVRYHTSRQNYWIAFETGLPVKLIRRDQDEHFVLAESDRFRVERDRLYTCRIRCEGARLTVFVDDDEILSVEDDAYGSGRIALRTEAPARFASVSVTADRNEAQGFSAGKRRLDDRLARTRERFPKPRRIHSVRVPVPFSYLHLQDVNDDGRPEIVAIEAQVMALDYIQMARISVFDWDGNLLWQIGEPRETKYRVHGDIAFNVADIDGDGRTEILITRDFEILILDGSTGEVKRRAPTPLALEGREDRFERTVGDSFLVCDLRGTGAPNDLILKNRYLEMWAYTCDLKPLWVRSLNTGHYPRAGDLNDDGRDEVMAGYSLLGRDGHTIWTVPGSDPLRNRYPGPEHCDSVLIKRFGEGEDAPVQIAMAASDLGFLLMDANGTVRARRGIGHAQNLGCARFRPDLPGRQFLIRTAWGNQGIYNLFDCHGNLLLIRELDTSGVMPVNWTGDGRALILTTEGLLDGNLDPVVPMAEARSARPMAYDFNGDGVDELFRIEGEELVVYTPESIPSDPVRGNRPSLTNFNLYGGFYL